MDVLLSLVIPAYNELARLPSYLIAVRAHLDQHYPDAYEVLVVDDGSGDGLPEFLAEQAKLWPQLAVLRHSANRGKGAAVRTGMLAARGEVLLFADADGATPIDQEPRLSAAIRGGAEVAIGSRLVDSSGAHRRRTWVRGLAGRVFARGARWWLGVSVRDTQCGFKMFRRDAGRRLFALAEESGYLFDLELLVLAGRLGYRVVEVPVDWTEVPGGHLSLMRDLGGILRALWRLQRRLALVDHASP